MLPWYAKNLVFYVSFKMLFSRSWRDSKIGFFPEKKDLTSIAEWHNFANISAKITYLYIGTLMLQNCQNSVQSSHPIIQSCVRFFSHQSVGLVAYWGQSFIGTSVRDRFKGSKQWWP